MVCAYKYVCMSWLSLTAVSQEKDIRIILAFMYEDKARNTTCQVQ